MRVAGLIIGHEILTGKFSDENGPFLIRRLRALGAELARLVVLEDDLDAIAREVARCSADYDAVVTTGGVGPTHDDVTLEAIARGLERPLVVEERLVELMRSVHVPINASTMRMAQVPEGTQLEYTPDSQYPVLRCHNVWVFPGVPKLFQVKFTSIEEHFRAEELHTARVSLLAREIQIAEQITTVASAHPAVTIGSYPRFDDGQHVVILTLEGRDRPAVERATEALRTAFVHLLDPTIAPSN